MMAIGTTTDTGPCRSVELLASATATNGAPSAATDGLDLNLVTQDLGKRPNQCSIVIASTAGSDVMTVTCKAWGYCPGGAVWVPLGTHATAASKGLLNQGNAITEHASDVLRHAEPLYNAFDFARVYLEITAIGGTATAITAWLQFRR